MSIAQGREIRDLKSRVETLEEAVHLLIKERDEATKEVKRARKPKPKAA
ncbi:MAG: hypothetical protein ACPHER_05320 [Nevskiales bacterium]